MPSRDRTLLGALDSVGERTWWEWDRLPTQQEFLLAPNQFTCFSGGFGNGKTTALCAKLLLLMTAIPNNLGYLGRLDGKALKHSTMQSLADMLPGEYIYRKDDQKGLLQLVPELGGSKLIYGDFKDINDLKNIPLGFFAIDQMEEVGEQVFNYLAGRLRRRTPVLTEDGYLQYFVVGNCPADKVEARHYALRSETHLDSRCRLCGVALPPFSDRPPDKNTRPDWDLVIYKRYGFGVANPEGPSHWIYRFFWGLPGQQGESTGKVDPLTGERYQGFHATIYDGLRAGFVDGPYVRSLEVLYQDKPAMWDRYILGRWLEAEGLVYPTWNRQLHLYPGNSVRLSGEPIIRSGKGYLWEYIDHGLTAPTAVGWVWTEKCDCGCGKTNFYVTREHYEGGRAVSYHATQIKAQRATLGNPPIQATYLDSQAFSKTLMRTKGSENRKDELFSIADEYNEYGVLPIPTQKKWEVGHNRISEHLLPDPNHVHPITGVKGAPHLLVSDVCGNFVMEVERYKWKVVKTALEPRQDEPMDGFDHHMDGLNGFIASRPEDVIEWAPPKEDNLEWELNSWEQPGFSHMGA